MVTCRASSCGMQFKSKYVRTQHEEMFHRNLFQDAVGRMIKQINSSHDEVALQKKVFYAGDTKFSYSEIAKLDTDSTEYKFIQATLTKFIEDWLDNTPNTTVEDFFRRARFHIVGQ